MLTKKQVIRYEILVITIFLSGLCLFTLQLITFNQADVFPAALVVSAILASLTSGIILFGRFMKNHSSTVLIVLSCVLFPLTFFIISFLGITTLIPMIVFHTILLIKHRHVKKDEPIPMSTSFKNIFTAITVIFAFSFIFGMQFFEQSLELQNKRKVAARIGFPENSVDTRIASDFYYDKDDPECFDNMDYQYIIKDNYIFTLIQTGASYCSPRYTYNPQTKMVEEFSPTRYSYTSHTLPLELDFLFSSVTEESTSHQYIFSLVVDARDEDKILESIRESFDDHNRLGDAESSDTYRRLALTISDPTHADPVELELIDNTGKALVKLISTDNDYAVYGDVVKKGDTNYSVTFKYKGDEFLLFTYDALENWLLTK